MAEQENAKQIEVISSIKAKKPELINNCYAVGLWVWAEFPQKPVEEDINLLKELGFRWNPKRKVWQNACGFQTRESKGDPRAKYQTLRIED